MAEFWWGESPKSLIRHHGQFYPACRGKCKPVLTWMLQGLEVDPHTDVTGAVHPEPAIIYEDEALVVLSKPAGMLSVPGKTGADSVSAWAQRRWPGAMLVHRLDMLTSGILLAAKTMEVYQELQQQFTQNGQEEIPRRRRGLTCEGTRYHRPAFGIRPDEPSAAGG